MDLIFLINTVVRATPTYFSSLLAVIFLFRDKICGVLCDFFVCVKPSRWRGTFASPVTVCSRSPAVTEHFGAVSLTALTHGGHVRVDDGNWIISVCLSLQAPGTISWRCGGTAQWNIAWICQNNKEDPQLHSALYCCYLRYPPPPISVSILVLLLHLIVDFFSSFFLFVCVRVRSCGVLVWTQVKCVFGTLRTLANRFTAWLYRTAPDVTAWSKLKTRWIHSTKKHTHKTHKSPTNALRGHLFLSRYGLAALPAILPKGRFTSWTQNATRSWRSCTATTTRWQRCALLRIGTSSVELENTTEKSPSGRWSRGDGCLDVDKVLLLVPKLMPSLRLRLRVCGNGSEDLCLTRLLILRDSRTRQQVYMKWHEPSGFLAPEMKWWVAVRNTNSTNMFLREYEGQLKTDKKSGCKFCWIRCVNPKCFNSLKVYTFYTIVMPYLMLYSVFVWYIIIVWPH